MNKQNYRILIVEDIDNQTWYEVDRLYYFFWIKQRYNSYSKHFPSYLSAKQFVDNGFSRTNRLAVNSDAPKPAKKNEEEYLS